MKYYVDMDKLKEDGEELIYYSKENLGTKYDELLSYLNELEWEGYSRDLFDDNYKMMIKKIKDIKDIIVKLGAFMVTCSENYNETEDKLISKWQENIQKYQNEEI